MAGWTLRHVIAPGLLVGGFLSVIGAYGSGRMPFAARTAYFVVIAVIASAMGAAAFRLARAVPVFRGRWREALGATLMMTLPMAAVVFVAQAIIDPPGAPLAAFPTFCAFSAATSLFFCLAVAGLSAMPKAAALPPAAPSSLARFLERLPPKLRGGDIWAIEAEDHYLRLHTSRGSDLILMRLADACEELAELEGARVHRSWWVARDAIADVRRRDGAATLILKDASEVPVSRPNAKRLRERGWF